MNESDPNIITTLSLIVAALAVIFGPLVSKKIAKQQLLGPMRQQWINDLRQLLSEISSSCLHYWQSGFEERTDKEYLRITDIEHRIMFMINPNEPKHNELIDAVKFMVRGLEKGKDGDDEFISSYKAVINLGRSVLKEEWNVVKKI